MLSTDGSVNSPAPVSALVDYTPRRAHSVARPDPLTRHGIHLFSRQSRDQYFQKLAHRSDTNHDDIRDTDNDDSKEDEEDRTYYSRSNAYMDSPQVRRYHGVSSKIAKINPYSDRPVRSLLTYGLCFFLSFPESTYRAYGSSYIHTRLLFASL